MGSILPKKLPIYFACVRACVRDPPARFGTCCQTWIELLLKFRSGRGVSKVSQPRETMQGLCPEAQGEDGEGFSSPIRAMAAVLFEAGCNHKMSTTICLIENPEHMSLFWSTFFQTRTTKIPQTHHKIPHTHSTTIPHNTTTIQHKKIRLQIRLQQP